MHSAKKLLEDLRAEYMHLLEMQSKAKFALATLPLNTKEKSLLDSQVMHMSWYAQDLIDRAEYAANKETEAKDEHN